MLRTQTHLCSHPKSHMHIKADWTEEKIKMHTREMENRIYENENKIRKQKPKWREEKKLYPFQIT